MMNYYLGFSYLNCSSLFVKKLLHHFGTIEDAWSANDLLYQRLPFNNQKRDLDKFLSERQHFSLEKTENDLKTDNIQWITLEDETYPSNLRHIYDPPYILYIQGEIHTIRNPVAFVGSRKATNYGKQATYKIISELQGHPITIISGLAVGIDAYSHMAAMDNHLKTAAVLGSGFHQFYPPLNKNLANKILEHNGCIMTEYPPHTAPAPYTFPLRNRIINGLADIVVVVEAAQKSGALITALHARDESRDLMVIPGNITSSLSEGSNNLIKQGAIPLTSGKEILTRLNLNGEIQSQQLNFSFDQLSPEEKALYDKLPESPVNVDSIIMLSGVPPHQALVFIQNLELEGFVRKIDHFHYIKST